jgi:CRP-like cAMP-binding protein
MTIGGVTAQQVLRECDVFSALTNAELEKVASLSLEKEYEVGTIILKEGESAEDLLLIREGKVALQITLPKEQVRITSRLTVDTVNRNEVFGWSAIVEPHVNSVTAVCLQKVKALSLSGNKLRWLLQDEPKVGYAVLKGLFQVVASRLNETRHLLISERLLSLRSEYV